MKNYTPGQHRPSAGSGQDFVMRGHARRHVIAHVAVEHPRADLVRHHVGGDHLRRRNGNHVGGLTAGGDHVAVPVRSMEVEPVAEGYHVPAHVLATLHGHHGPVAVDVAVDRPLDGGIAEAAAGKEVVAGAIHRRDVVSLYSFWIGGVGLDVVVEIPALALVVSHEQGHEFAIHVFGRAIGASHAAARDHQGADEPGIDVLGLLDMGMVEPDHGTGICRPRTGTIDDFPGVEMSLAGLDHTRLLPRHSAVGRALR